MREICTGYENDRTVYSQYFNNEQATCNELADTILKFQSLHQGSSVLQTVFSTISKSLKLRYLGDLFVAGLFYNSSEISSCSLIDSSGDDIATQHEDFSINLPRERAQQELLGVTFNEHTIGLVTGWQLIPILRLALLELNIHDPYVQCLSENHAVVT